MNCVCKEWAEGISQIAAQAVFCSNQFAGPEYTAAKFGFCPWCGKPVEALNRMELKKYGDVVYEILGLDISKDVKVSSILTLFKPEPITSDDLQWAKDKADELREEIEKENEINV